MTDTPMPSDAPEVEAGETPPPNPLAAEVEKWKSLSQKNEKRASENAAAAKELAALKAQSMSDIDRAVAEARAETAAEVSARFGRRLVEAEIRSALSGRHPNVDGLLAGIDPGRFLDAEGEPDSKAIQSWADSAAVPVPDTPAVPAVFDLGQGVRRTASTDSAAQFAAALERAGF